MNQQQFEFIFENLTTRPKEVLQRILAGETDADIAVAMEIGAKNRTSNLQASIDISRQ
jgi:FixJ family two-component response regulator